MKEKWKQIQETKNKDRKKHWGGGPEDIVKRWELNDFVVHLSLVFSN